MNPLVLAVVFAALGRASLPVDPVTHAPQRSTPAHSLAFTMPRAVLAAEPRTPDVFTPVAPHTQRPRAWSELGAQLTSALRGVPLGGDEPAPRLTANLQRGLMEPQGAPSQAGVHGVKFTLSGQF